LKNPFGSRLNLLMPSSASSSTSDMSFVNSDGSYVLSFGMSESSVKLNPKNVKKQTRATAQTLTHFLRENDAYDGSDKDEFQPPSTSS
jgi:hypothetical protein